MAGKYSLLRAWCALGSFFAAFGLLLPASAADHAPARDIRPARAKPGIRVAHGNWGRVDVRDLQRFLEAVTEEFQAYAADPGQAPARIRVVPRGGSPRVLYDRSPDGEYVVHLSARNDTWFQYAYQFSHELCHIHSRFDHKERQGDEVASVNQWFEESLCETAALFTLRRLAASWAETPPGRLWQGYGPVLASYADFLQEQPHRRLPADGNFAQWYRENETALQDNPYQREKNELVAAALLPLFEADPNRWRAIAHLNPEPGSAAKDFGGFLADWYAACPPEERELVRQTMALFDVQPPVPRLAALFSSAGK